MHITLGDGRRKYSVLASVRQRSNVDNTVSSDIAGGAVKVDTVARTFEIDLDTFRNTPGNEEAPRLMRDEVVTFLSKDQGHGQMFRAKRTGKAKPIFETHDIQTFTTAADGVSLFFTDHLGRLFSSVDIKDAAAIPMGGELKGFEIVGFSKELESLVLIQRDEATLRYCVFSQYDERPETLYEMPLAEHGASRSEALSPDGTRLYLESSNVLLDIDLEDRSVREKHLDQAGPWKMMDLDVLAALDERFLLLQNEARGREIFLYDLEQSEYYLQQPEQDGIRVDEIVLMGGEARYSRYDRRFPGEKDYGRKRGIAA